MWQRTTRSEVTPAASHEVERGVAGAAPRVEVDEEGGAGGQLRRGRRPRARSALRRLDGVGGADLADDARAHALGLASDRPGRRPPRPRSGRGSSPSAQRLHAALGEPGRLRPADVVAAAHDDVQPGPPRESRQRRPGRARSRRASGPRSFAPPAAANRRQLGGRDLRRRPGRGCRAPRTGSRARRHDRRVVRSTTAPASRAPLRVALRRRVEPAPQVDDEVLVDARHAELGRGDRAEHGLDGRDGGPAAGAVGHRRRGRRRSLASSPLAWGVRRSRARRAASPPGSTPGPGCAARGTPASPASRTRAAAAGRPDLLLDRPRAVRHHHHAVGDVDRLVHVVGHEEDGEPVALPDPGEELLHEEPGLRVEGTERLVHEQDRAAGSRAPGRSRPAASSRPTARAGTRRRAPRARPSRGARARRRGAPARLILSPWSANSTFSRAVEPGEERVRLEDHAAVAAGPVDRDAVHEDLPAVCSVRPGDDREQRRLPAPRGPDEGDELVLARATCCTPPSASTGPFFAAKVLRRSRCRGAGRARAPVGPVGGGAAPAPLIARPPEGAPPDELHRLVGDEPEDAEDDEVADDRLGLEVALRDRDPVAEAGGRGDELGEDDPRPRPAERDPQRVPDRRARPTGR